jgi:hypothetical protein
MVGERERRGGRGRVGGISTTRFTALTCDAVARAGERAEKQELFTLLLSSEATMAEKMTCFACD